MNSDRDFLDKIFDKAHNIVHKVSQYVENSEEAAIKNGSAILNKILHKGSQVIDAGTNTTIPRSDNDNILRNITRLPFTLLSGIHTKRSWSLMAIPAVSIALYWGSTQLKVRPILSTTENQCILVFGDMRDPIIRGQVMDLYRRGFTLFVCLENAGTYKTHNDEDDFLNYIDPKSTSDWAKFSEFFRKFPTNTLPAILLIPKLSYHPTGQVTLEQLENELHSNVLIYYSTLVAISPHLPQNSNSNRIPTLIYNPSLSVNMKNVEHPVEWLISGLMTTIFEELKHSHIFDPYMINVGLFQLGGQLSNYKYLNVKGSNIYNDLYWPIYCFIKMKGGNTFQKLHVAICSLFGLKRTFYLGKFSYLFTLPFTSKLYKLLNEWYVL
ncbi:related to UPF0744 protein YSD83 [Nakaseomyces glabratus]|nr:Fungal family of unknown function (DUF1776) [Nakaseomyces glabratus]QNG12191.1 uncharacterized protein GWK60_A01947 [Nakaseomyces glabratus]SCV16523.1 related to UPF0744 protein YSD83 [Nakaseomyces glabratus]SLM16321.1 related to UPF0744 protein YSD83 [Nakaseomyces glabratus]